MDKVRILFLPMVDADNTNAQSLNVREIVLRLDPGLFETTLWYESEPDSRLQKRPGIRLKQLPSRGKSRRILGEMMAGYDIIGYVDYSPASYLFLHLPRTFRRGARAAFHAEAPAAQMVNPSRTLRFLFDGIYPRCDVYSGITEFVGRDVFNNLARKVSHILPVGVDTRWFSPPSERTNPVPVVLFAGTVMERKGPQYVVDAAARFPGARFRIVGAGRHGFEKIVQQRITQLGLTNISLDGPRTQSQMLDIMQASDIFLLPSRMEGIPKVTLEASSTGLPCIVFGDYDTPSVVDGLTGFQVRTLEEMMQALGKLIADRSLRERMGIAARRHVEGFDWDIVARKWQNAYLEIAAVPVK
jgi:glycosyltransferase involved in cell wall biosynthesis